MPVPAPGALAAACGAVGVSGLVLPTDDSGRAPCIVVLDEPGTSGVAAGRLSRVLGRAAVIELVRTEERLEAVRWERGRVVDRPPAGLLVQGLPDLVTSVLVGGVDPSGRPDAVVTGRGRGPSGAGRGGVIRGYLDGDRVARRRRMDRWASWVLVVVLALLALTESLRAVTADGSWVVVALASVVALGVGLRAARLRDTAEDRPPSSS